MVHGITIWMVYSDVECINCMCACVCIRSFVFQVADFLCKLFQQTPSCTSACYRGITDAYTPILLYYYSASTCILLPYLLHFYSHTPTALYPYIPNPILNPLLILLIAHIGFCPLLDLICHYLIM